MNFINTLVSILIPLALISVLVLVHEFGHFIVARKNGVLVHEFSLGMGPKIYGIQKGEILYAIRAFPIGGFVRMEGEDELSDDPRAFNKKTPLQRIAVIFAGPFMNFIFAFVVYLIITAISLVPVTTIYKTMDNMPIKTAGLRPGDTIVAINGNKMNLQEDISFEVSFVNKSKKLDLTYSRNGVEKTINIKPKYVDGSYKLGYIPKYRRLNIIDNVVYSFRKLLYDGKLVFVGLKYMVTGKVTLKQIAGPVGMGKMTNDVAKSSGFIGVVVFGAFLSLNLGLMNLLPIPALDGSRILFLFVELLRGKPVDQEKEAMVHFAGFVLLMIFMVVVTFSDISKFFK